MDGSNGEVEVVYFPRQIDSFIIIIIPFPDQGLDIKESGKPRNLSS